MKFILIVIVMWHSCNAFSKETKELFFGTSAETVKLPFGEKTVLEFEKRIKRYSRSSSYTISPEDEANPDYTTLAIAPMFTSGSDRVTFYLEDGKIIRVKFVTVKNPDTAFKELTYILRSKHYFNSSKSPVIGEIELMKAMINDESVSGFKNRSVNQKVKSGKRGVSSKLIRIYEGQYLNGYVFRMKNHLWKNKIKINLKDFKLGAPDMAILSQADEPFIFPKGKGNNSTLVRIVTKPVSNSRNIRLPMTSEKLDK